MPHSRCVFPDPTAPNSNTFSRLYCAPKTGRSDEWGYPIAEEVSRHGEAEEVQPRIQGEGLPGRSAWRSDHGRVVPAASSIGHSHHSLEAATGQADPLHLRVDDPGRRSAATHR